MKRDEFYTTIGRAFELLGNPLRLQIYLRILEEGCDCDLGQQTGPTGNCVSGIMKELRLPQSTVSTYIKELTEGGLVDCQRRGKFLYCAPNRAMLVHIKSFVEGALKQIPLRAVSP